MSLLSRIQSGLIYADEFTGTQLDNTVWTISPSDPNFFDLGANPGSLTLFPDNAGGLPIMALLSCPQMDSYVLDVKNSFTPSSYGDTAGLVALRGEDDRVTLMQYSDSSSASVAYTNMRLQYKDGAYIGWGSTDNGQTWNIVGTVTTDNMNYMGLLLQSPVIEGAHPVTAATPQQTITSPMVVDYTHIYRDSKITIGNLTPGMIVTLYDQNDNQVAKDICLLQAETVSFDLINASMPLLGYFQITDASGAILDTSSYMNIWGGDEFLYALRLEVYRADVTPWGLSEDQDNYIGQMQAGVIENRYQVINPAPTPVAGVLAAIDILPGFIGNTIQVAPDSFGSPGEYQDTVALGAIPPGGGVYFWIKVTKDPNLILTKASKYSFRVVLSTN